MLMMKIERCWRSERASARCRLAKRVGRRMRRKEMEERSGTLKVNREAEKKIAMQKEENEEKMKCRLKSTYETRDSEGVEESLMMSLTAGYR